MDGNYDLLIGQDVKGIEDYVFFIIIKKEKRRNGNENSV